MRVQALVLAAAGILAACIQARDLSYADDYSRLGQILLDVRASQCSSHAFKVPAGQYQVVLEPRFPQSCSAGTAVRATDELFRRDECVVFEKDGSCAEVLRNTDDLCKKWDIVGKEMTQDSWPATFEGKECWAVEYYLAFSSNCTETFQVVLQTKIKELAEDQSEACDGYEAAKQLYTLTIILIVLLPVMLVIILSSAWYCFYCSVCPIHKMVHEARRPIVYHASRSSDRLLSGYHAQMS